MKNLNLFKYNYLVYAVKLPGVPSSEPSKETEVVDSSLEGKKKTAVKEIKDKIKGIKEKAENLLDLHELKNPKVIWDKPTEYKRLKAIYKSDKSEEYTKMYEEMADIEDEKTLNTYTGKINEKLDQLKKELDEIELAIENRKKINEKLKNILDETVKNYEDTYEKEYDEEGQKRVEKKHLMMLVHAYYGRWYLANKKAIDSMPAVNVNALATEIDDVGNLNKENPLNKDLVIIKKRIKKMVAIWLSGKDRRVYEDKNWDTPYLSKNLSEAYDKENEKLLPPLPNPDLKENKKDGKRLPDSVENSFSNEEEDKYMADLITKREKKSAAAAKTKPANEDEDDDNDKDEDEDEDEGEDTDTEKKAQPEKKEEEIKLETLSLSKVSFEKKGDKITLKIEGKKDGKEIAPITKEIKIEPFRLDMQYGSSSFVAQLQNFENNILTLWNVLPKEIISKIENIQELTSRLVKESAPTITVVGRASFDGDYNENLVLAEKRAKTVIEKMKKIIPDLNVEPKGIVINPLQPDKPLDKGFSEEEIWKGLFERLKAEKTLSPEMNIAKLKEEFAKYNKNSETLDPSLKAFFDKNIGEYRSAEVKIVPSKDFSLSYDIPPHLQASSSQGISAPTKQSHVAK